MRQAAEIIRKEHQALAAVLHTIMLLIAQHQREGTTPAFDALRAMLFYIGEFPEQRHHKKETELLFPKLRARTPAHRNLLDRLDQEHYLGELRIRELEHALLAFEMLGEGRRSRFETTTAHYVEFCLRHMHLEEREILPLAERVLSASDWDELDEAFAENGDPLAGGAGSEAEYAALFTRIVRLVPAQTDPGHVSGA
jgi:hemerythrin-like domain-containing protein